MLAVTTVEKHADQLADLIEERLGIRGRGLEVKLRRAGRAMPRYIRREATRIVQAKQLTANPKLMRQVDPSGIEAAYKKCETWLKSVNPNERRKGAALSLLATNAFNLLAIGGSFLAWAVWSGNF